MTWPKRYGGGGRSFLERYVVTEEFRIANAPVGLHFTADRQKRPDAAGNMPMSASDQSGNSAAHRSRRMLFLHRYERAEFRGRICSPPARAPTAAKADGGFAAQNCGPRVRTTPIT